MRVLSTYLSLLLFLLFSSNIKSADNNFNLPDGIIYQIAVDINDIAITNKVIDQYYYPMKVAVDNKVYSKDVVVGKRTTKLFQFGKYRNYSEVDSVVILLGDMGCRTANVSAYLNGYSISIPNAIATQYEVEIDAYVKRTKRNTENVYLIEVAYLVKVKQSTLKHYYSLAVLVKNPNNVDLLLDKLGNEQVSAVSVEDGIYAVGKYESFDEVVEARKTFINNNVNDVFIMAQFIDGRITVEDNKGLEYAIKPVVTTLASK